jgi:hypothetical protein
MRCELTGNEEMPSKPVLPNQPRDPPPRHHQEPQQLHRLRWYVAATLPVPKAILHARHEIRCCKGLQSTDARSM